MQVNHKERDHALLSASGASRWMACPPSALLEDELPDSESSFAMEGTLAHEACEILLRRELGRLPKREVTKALNALKKHELWNDEILEHAGYYVEYIISRFKREEAEDILIEQRLDFSRYVPEGFGTGDCIIIKDGCLTIIDFKYGKGVEVSAVENTQMKLYALGAIEMYNFMYEFSRVEMVIYQPRLNNVSEYTVFTEDIERWGDTIVKPRAQLAIKGEGEFATGDHCRFCKLKASCKTLANENLELFEDLDEKPNEEQLNTIEPDLYARILGNATQIKNWLTAIEDYCITKMLSGELKVPGYKVVEGRSNRKYTNEDEVIAALKESGKSDDEIFEKKLLTITKMEKLLKKKGFEELLGDLVEKPKGKPTIAPEKDKRPEYSNIDDFDNLDEN